MFDVDDDDRIVGDDDIPATGDDDDDSASGTDDDDSGDVTGDSGTDDKTGDDGSSDDDDDATGLKEALRKERKERRRLSRELKKLQSKQDKGDDSEETADKLRDATRRAEKAEQRATRLELQFAAAQAGALNPKQAARLVDIEEYEDEDNPAEAAIADLKETDSYLFESAKDRKRREAREASTASNTGRQGKSKPPSLDEYLKMTDDEQEQFEEKYPGLADKYMVGIES